MLGAIIGDIVGSRFEFDNIRSKDFTFLDSKQCYLTDDSIMTLAIAKAFLNCNGNYTYLDRWAVYYMQNFGMLYPNAGYGRRFRDWLKSTDPKPYNSFGNGSAMRVSSCAYVGKTLEEAVAFSDIVTSVTHNHPEGIRGARVTAACTFLALHGASKSEIKNHVVANYAQKDDFYNLEFTLADIAPTFRFDESCQGTVPQAIMCFLESSSYTDAIRNCMYLGGDCDTTGAICGAIAGAFYGIEDSLREEAIAFFDEKQREVFFNFEDQFIKK